MKIQNKKEKKKKKMTCRADKPRGRKPRNVEMCNSSKTAKSKTTANGQRSRKAGKQKDTVKKSHQKQTKTARKQSDKASETDSTPCGVCAVIYCDDNSGRNWIECSGCKTWYHNACQGLDENELSAFLCISCDF